LSRLLANQISMDEKSGSSDAAFISTAFERILGRPPSELEMVESREFLRTQAGLLSNREKLTPFPVKFSSGTPASDQPHLRARENLAHALFNHNEFVTIR